MLRKGLQRVLQPLASASRAYQGVAETSSSEEAAAAAGHGFKAAFPGWLASGKARVNVPLTQALPGAASPGSAAAPHDPPPTEVTALSNGMRIVSEATLGPISSLGVYVSSGSIHETAANSGASALLECLAYKSTKHRHALRVAKEVELLGANIMANASREQMSYTIDFLRSQLAPALELLADCVLNPAMVPQEVEEQKARLRGVLSAPDAQPTLVTEALVRASYRGALSNPLIPDPQRMDHLTPQVLDRFVAQQYTPNRMVLAGAGVEHAQLVDLAAPMLELLPAAPGASSSRSSGSSSSSSDGGGGSTREFGSSSSSSSSGLPADPPSHYVGGFASVPGPFPQANLTLAFEYAGGWRDIQGSVVMTVLTYLLGGGNSFSSGGPGKGMHSRLYTRVLNRHHWVHSCSAFSSTFNDSGLMGISGAAEPSHASALLDVVCLELEALASPPPAEQLERAKAMAVSLIHNALESKSASAEDVGRQYITYGQRVSGTEYVDMINAVTPKQVAEFARRLLGSRPSLAVFGDGSDAVRYEALLQRYEGGGAGARVREAGGGAVDGVFGRLRAGMGGLAAFGRPLTATA